MDGSAMATFNISIVDSYKSFMERNGDPRTEKWWLMSGTGPLITLLVSYLYFCTTLGPRIMRDRKPFALKYTIVLYNISQILLSIFLVYEGLVAGWWSDYNFSCQPVDYSDTPKAKRMAAAVWWYFFAKVVELLDTIFFVLRKKNRQISFLHLYHHTMMPICAWIGVKFLPGGHGTLLGVINSFIHIVMYTYYLISGLGPQYQKYIWWKKHLTTLQLVQFCIIFYHNFTVMFRDCNYPKFINFLLSLNAGLFLYMFGNFYYINYIKNAKRSVTKNGSLANGHANSNESKKITNSHEKISNGLEKMPNGHEKISNGHEKMSNGYGKVTNRLESFSNGHEKMSNGHEKMSNGHEKMSNGHGKMLNGKEKNLNGTNGLKKPLNDVAYEKKDC